jgi:hypothetical protein
MSSAIAAVDKVSAFLIAQPHSWEGGGTRPDAFAGRLPLRLRRYARAPRPAKPTSSIAQVDGSRRRPDQVDLQSAIAELLPVEVDQIVEGRVQGAAAAGAIAPAAEAASADTAIGETEAALGAEGEDVINAGLRGRKRRRSRRLLK